MAKQYWLSFLITAHPKHPVSHSDHMNLHYYFDADGTLSESEALSEGPYKLNDKRITAGVGRAYLSTQSVYHFNITHEQFNSPKFKLYIWIGDLGAAALRLPSYSNNLVGRLELTLSHAEHKGGLTIRPPSSQPNDEQILFEFEIGDSVAQFIAQEMNRNKNAQATKEMRDVMNNRGVYGQDSGRAPLSQQHRTAIAEGIFGHQTHVDYHPDKPWYKEIATAGQDLFFGGGGEWDHKPIIFETWGSSNRLGNSGFVYYYDVWSNLHYGYIAAAGGLPLSRVVAGAGFAQGVDSGSGWQKILGVGGALLKPPNWRPDEEMKQFLFSDAPSDRRAIMAGYGLYDREVSYKEIVNIVSQFPDSWLVER